MRDSSSTYVTTRRPGRVLGSLLALALSLFVVLVPSSAAAQQLPDDVIEQPTDSTGDGDDGLALPVVIGSVVLALAFGVGVGWVLARTRRPSPPQPLLPESPTTGRTAPVAAAEEGVGPDPTLVEDLERQRDRAATASAERSTLVRALIDVVDTATSEAIRTQVTQHLASVGVEPLSVPAGSLFEPERQRGVHAAAASRPEDDGKVAACDRVGWADNGSVIRPPEVVVLRWEQSS